MSSSNLASVAIPDDESRFISDPSHCSYPDDGRTGKNRIQAAHASTCYALDSPSNNEESGELVDGMVGRSRALRSVLHEIQTVAPTDSTVLIYGETGTGKELIARAIHELSSRRTNPAVKVNGAAIPTGLLESELFGHERGDFTGAIGQRIGRFDVANHGTAFLYGPKSPCPTLPHDYRGLSQPSPPSIQDWAEHPSPPPRARWKLTIQQERTDHSPFIQDT